ncbi:MAG: dihydrofolate reductase [Porticoccaceae bacterium]
MPRPATCLGLPPQYASRTGPRGPNILYRQTLVMVDHIYLPQVATTVEDDAFFPAIDHALWRQTERKERLPQASGLGYQFVVFDRRTA